MAATKTCVDCKVPFASESDGKKRCNPCNALTVRVSRIKDAETKDKFKKLDKEQRMKFFTDKHEDIGKDLNATIQTLYAESQVEEHSSALMSGGAFLD